MENNSLKYTCLFGGGAIRGAAHVGAIKALEELSIRPVNLAGSSVGAIVAAMLALGYTAKEIKEVFLEVNFDLFRDIQLGLGPKFALSKGEVFLEWIRDLIEKKYYGDNYEKGKNKAVTFNDIEKNLVVITTDISNFSCKEFSKFETPDYEIASAVRISCSMPGLMKPVEYNNTLLVDGDLQKSMPMWRLSKHLLNDSERVLEFRLEGEVYDNDKNALEYMNTIYSCVTAMCTTFIAETYGNRDKFDYIILNTGDALIVDFNCSKEKREELIENGYVQTMEYFNNVLPKKKEALLERYNTIQKYIKQAEKFIQNKKYLKAKNLLCELFVKLTEYEDTIDRAITKEIQNFYREYSANLKYPALFGKISLKKEADIIKNIRELSEKLHDKVYELEYYLVKHPI